MVNGSQSATQACFGRTWTERTLLQIAGPGIRYAAVAVDVSPLGQATREGACHGLCLLATGLHNSSWFSEDRSQKSYLIISILLSVGVLIMLACMMKPFATFMDMVSIILFVISPLIAVQNHWAVVNDTVPRCRPVERGPEGVELRGHSLLLRRHPWLRLHQVHHAISA